MLSVRQHFSHTWVYLSASEHNEKNRHAFFGRFDTSQIVVTTPKPRLSSTLVALPTPLMRNILNLPSDECDLRHFTSKCDIFTGCLFIGGYDSLIGVDSEKKMGGRRHIGNPSRVGHRTLMQPGGCCWPRPRACYGRARLMRLRRRQEELS